MRYLPLVIGAVTSFAAGSASAQSVNLTGNYRCVQDCLDGNLGGPAFVTQNGDSLNLVTETGESYRAWPDVTAPARYRAQTTCRLSAIAHFEPDHGGRMAEN
jgi:hypothetical protein